MSDSSTSNDPVNRLGQDQRLGSFRTFRWAMFGLWLLFGAWLFVRGDILFGAIVGSLAIVRLVWMLNLTKNHHRTYGQAIDPGFRQILRPMARSSFIVAAETIGMTPSKIGERFRGGESISEMASTAHVSLDQVTEAITQAATTQIDERVTSGSLTAASAEKAKSSLPQWSLRLVQIHRSEIRH